VALTALASTGRFDEFEELARMSVEKHEVAADDVLEMLLELVDLGVDIPARAFTAARRLEA
jgi:hypothetical protein